MVRSVMVPRVHFSCKFINFHVPLCFLSECIYRSFYIANLSKVKISLRIFLSTDHTVLGFLYWASVDTHKPFNYALTLNLHSEAWIHPAVRISSFPVPNGSSFLLMLLLPNLFKGLKCPTYLLSSAIFYLFYIGPWGWCSLPH